MSVEFFEFAFVIFWTKRPTLNSVTLNSVALKDRMASLDSAPIRRIAQTLDVSNQTTLDKFLVASGLL